VPVQGRNFTFLLYFQNFAKGPKKIVTNHY